ncbi:hypothetical protein [Shewanella sp. OMA3-2]|uniref:hypothetical protein n=1 Tax=Shewanella sp. OMA3-2 TaxID=2908650 RepID=UPI001F206774|nr:hypothetical protein [Shewanella sp. OMA3-2]UJF22532.1 hypothetical protein L0B17_03740 [Shewanella sp. OMA3-2]
MELRPHRLFSYLSAKPMISIFAMVTTSTLVVLISFAFSSSAKQSSDQACACKANVNYNSSLPSSHPVNRCAVKEHDVSWKNWISGNSRSSQFHFIDLIELLYGHKDKPLTDIPASNNPEQI